MTQNNRILIAVVAAVLAAAAFFFLVISPKRDQMAQLDADIATTQQALQAAEKLAADYTRAKATYQTSYASVVRLGKAVPADDDLRSLVVQLESAANRSAVDFRTIDVGGGQTAGNAAKDAAAGVSLPPGATVGEAGFPVMPVNFAFRGSFPKLSKFFSRLDRFVTVQNNEVNVSGRLLLVDSISLTPDATLGYPYIRAQVGATSYLVSPQQGATGGATAAGPATAGGAAQPASTTPSTTATSTGGLR